jgi:hypothetical protein
VVIVIIATVIVAPLLMTIVIAVLLPLEASTRSASSRSA